MVEFPEVAKDLNISDRYSIAEYFEAAADLILDSDRTGDTGNLAQDMAPRVLRDLRNELKVTSKHIQEAIYIFYRENPETIDQLRDTLEGAAYLRGLEAQI